MKNKYFKFIDRFYPLIWIIISTFIVVILLEYTTPPEYVFGYLYTGTILLANYGLEKETIWRVTVAAIVLTLFNIIFPGLYKCDRETVANRIIAVLALATTAWLSIKVRQYKEEIVNSQAQLKNKERLASLREDFVFTLTHDLKTPLLGAIATLEALGKGQFGVVSPTQTRVLATMSNSHTANLQLVETLLDVYRNDTEGLQLQQGSVNLAEVASKVITSLTNLAASRQVYVILNYGSSDFSSRFVVDGDALQLQRVFTNLITNGIQHSPRNEKVEVQLQREGKFQVVKVCDRGSGITDEELPQVFERFYQGTNSRTSKGSGLGLYLSRQIITAHRGTIWAENRFPKGAIFGFCLPATAE